jgi:hypothetical protein
MQNALRKLFQAFVVATLLLVPSQQETALAQVPVSGYTRKDGTYVAPHTRSCPGGSCGSNATGTTGARPTSFSNPSTQVFGSSSEAGSSYWEVPLDCGLSVADMRKLETLGSIAVTKGNCHIFMQKH